MKFSIENIRTTKSKVEHPNEQLEKSLTVESIKENISHFCENVIIQEQEIGFGNYSFVYQDTKDNGMCYKKFKPNAEARMNNTVARELSFMEKVYGLDAEVKTPYPMGLAEVVIRNNENGTRFLNKIIAMEYFENSTRLEDVIEPKTEILKTDFPESFDKDIFFQKLNDYIEKMHNKLGIYHRDLFARNILINNTTGNPIVIDFGDAAFNPVDENYDAYGRRKYSGQEYEDKDLKNIKTMKEEVERYIDKLQK